MSAFEVQVGGDGTAFDLRDFRIHPGDANVWMRRFERGLVVVNGTPTERDIELPGVYRTIKGTQDESYTGQGGLTSLRLKAYDAAFLLLDQEAG